LDITALEHDLRTYRPPGQTGWPAQLIWPRYEGLSVGNLPATLLQLFGVEATGLLPPLRADLLAGLTDGVERVVVLTLDGLGWEQLQAVMARYDDLIFHRLAERGRLLPLTTIFPSTTNNVLATLRTGVAPVTHGLLAYELYLREFHVAAECISFSPLAQRNRGLLADWGLEAEHFLPVPSLAMQMAAAGLPTEQVIAGHLISGPLSEMYFRGVREIHGHSAASDFWVTLQALLRAHAGERLLLDGYWSAVDTLAHRHGPQHLTGEAEVRSIAYMLEALFLKGLRATEREGTLLLILADHGQLRTPAEGAVVLSEHPELRERLLLPSLGEARAPFLYVRSGQEAWVRAYLETHFEESFHCLSQAELLASGLLGPGPVYGETPHRLGDLICIAKGDQIFVRDRTSLERLKGRHGGLLAPEMLVPLFAVRLEAL